MATEQEIESFLGRFVPIAQKLERWFGIPTSVTLGQAAHETGWGTSGQATNNNNYFGLKKQGDAGTVRQVSGEYENGKYVARYSNFGNYTEAEQSFYDYGKLLSSAPRYQTAFQATNPYDFVSRVASAGYATDPNYASSVANVIKSRNLTQYDVGGKVVGSAPAEVVSVPTMRFQNPEADKYLRANGEYMDIIRAIRKNGYELGSDDFYTIPIDAPFINDLNNDLLYAMRAAALFTEKEQVIDAPTDEDLAEWGKLGMSGNIVRTVISVSLIGVILVLAIMAVPKAKAAAVRAVKGG